MLPIPFRFRLALAALKGKLYRDAPSEWGEVEFAVEKRMDRALSEEIALGRDLEALAFEMISAVRIPEDHQELFHVHATLTVRSLQDLRCCIKTARTGYTMQCWSLAASAFEAANMAGYIGANQERATRWREHKELKYSTTNVKDSVMGTVKFFELADTPAEIEDLVERDYELYGHLCTAKHVNPVSERYRYWTGSEGMTRLTFTPVFSDTRTKEAKLGISLACRAGIVALGILGKVHLEDNEVLISDRFRVLAKRTAKVVAGWKELT